ncbi:unnamed protein product, partial [Phyllotreta striolata]
SFKKPTGQKSDDNENRRKKSNRRINGVEVQVVTRARFSGSFRGFPSIMKSSVAVFAMLVVVCGFNHVIARPNSRIKRVSDSHLADLETKIAMNNRIRGFAITLPIGGGRIDPSQIFCHVSVRVVEGKNVRIVKRTVSGKTPLKIEKRIVYERFPSSLSGNSIAKLRQNHLDGIKKYLFNNLVKSIIMMY